MDIVTLEKWLRCGFIESSNWFATEEGAPQGGIITPLTQKVISNLSG
jgi:RNA-directed DNA polymerase